MWPWGHAAVGYLVLSLLTLAYVQRWPSRVETIVVLVATQLPDLIDKPLAWSFDLLPAGRSLAHSLLTATVMLLLVRFITIRYGRRSLFPTFSIGYIIHLLTDIPLTVLGGDLSPATFLLWPLLSAPEYEVEPSFIAHISAIELSSGFVLQLLGAILVGMMVIRNLRTEPIHE